MKDKKDQRLIHIDMVRVEDGKAHVLGYRYNRFMSNIYYHTTHDIDTGEILEEICFKERNENGPFLFPKIKQGIYKSDIKIFERDNLKDLDKYLKDIRVYQGTIEEVSKDLGKKLERVDIKGSETFIRQEDTLFLRLKAKMLGANAIVHYQPGSSIGTPVRFVDEGK